MIFSHFLIFKWLFLYFNILKSSYELIFIDCMNIIRKAVSGKKNRLEEDPYDLDITYITPRIIAMSFPGEGLQQTYRNSMDDVSAFLNERHSKYRVYNLSMKSYD